MGDEGYEPRTFYLNALYLIMTLLGILFAITLNAEVSATDTSIVYQTCRLNGTATELINGTGGTGCHKFNDSNPLNIIVDGHVHPFHPIAAQQDEFGLLQTLFNISVATAVVNALLFVHSVVMHYPNMGIEYHFDLQWAFSIINIGLFAGLLGNLLSIEIMSDWNQKDNIYFKDLNVYAVVVAGLVIAILDLVCSNVIIYLVCSKANGYDCAVGHGFCGVPRQQPKIQIAN